MASICCQGTSLCNAEVSIQPYIQVEGAKVEIIAIAHHRRKPG